MGEPFIGQEFRHEHDKKRAQEENIAEETEVAVTIAETLPEEGDGLPDNKKETGQEERAHKGIEDRIGRIVVAPVLIAPKVILDE